MLSRPHRLVADKDFARVLKRGFLVSEGSLSIKAVHAMPGKPVRAGVVVSVKVSKRAVVRNTLKRRLRELIRPHVASFGAGVDLVIMTKPGAEKLEFTALESLVNRLVKKLLAPKTTKV